MWPRWHVFTWLHVPSWRLTITSLRYYLFLAFWCVACVEKGKYLPKWWYPLCSCQTLLMFNSPLASHDYATVLSCTSQLEHLKVASYLGARAHHKAAEGYGWWQDGKPPSDFVQVFFWEENSYFWQCQVIQLFSSMVTPSFRPCSWWYIGMVVLACE